MPSYYHQKNTIVYDSIDAATTRVNENTIGTTPSAKHTEAHEQFTRNALEAISDAQGGDEDLIYDKVVSLGGYIYLTVDYDYTDFFTTLKFESYFPTKAIFDTYHEWLLTINILSRNRIDDTDQTAEELYADPDNSPGRGYTNIVRSYVDFNKPYRT